MKTMEELQDPFKNKGFQKIGKRIGKMVLPTVIVQEGGYLCPELGLNLSSFLEGFISGRGL